MVRRRRWFTWKGRTERGLPRYFGSSRFGLMHAHKGGAPVLRGEASWRTVNGFYGNVFGGYFTLVFRRHLPW